MTTIAPHSPITTLINIFTVDPVRADELVDVLTSASDKVMQFIPGFISANIHLSADRTRVANYAQWDSAEAYAAMLKNPAAGEHMRQAADIADGFEPHLYKVISVHNRR